MSTSNRLRDKSVAVLSLIAEGYSYSQIVDGHPGISYLDIFAAAEEALRANESQSTYQQRLEAIKSKHPRAYEPWTADDDAGLAEMSRQNRPVTEMSARFKRQPSAIRSRLAKLGLSAGDQQ